MLSPAPAPQRAVTNEDAPIVPNDAAVIAARARLDVELLAGPTLLESLAAKPSWQVRVNPGDLQSRGAIFPLGDRVYVNDGFNALNAILVGDGRAIWICDVLDSDDELLSVFTATTKTAERIFLVSGEGIAIASADTGDFQSRARVDFFPGTAAVVYNDFAIFGNPTGRLGWERIGSAVPWWGSTLPGGIRTPPILIGGTVAVASDRGRVGVWVAESSQSIWSFNLGGGVYGTLSTDGNLLFCASKDQSVYGFDHRSGRVVWKYFTESPIESDTVCIRGRVYVQIPGQGLVALRADGGNRPDGQVIWTSKAPGNVIGLFANRLIVWDAATKTLSAVEPLDGNIILSKRVALARVKMSAAVDGDLYLLGSDGRLQRLTPAFPTAPETVPASE